MKAAVLKTTSGGDKLRFEVHSTPSRGHTSIQKWYMKGMVGLSLHVHAFNLPPQPTILSKLLGGAKLSTRAFSGRRTPSRLNYDVQASKVRNRALCPFRRLETV
jgi:hypothetical protein